MPISLGIAATTRPSTCVDVRSTPDLFPRTEEVLAAVLVGFVFLRRLLGPLRLRDTARLYVRLVIAAVIARGLALGAVSGLAALLPHTESGQLSWAATVVQLVVGGVVLVAAYLALAHVIHVREVGQVLDPLLRRVRPRRSFAGD